MNHNLPALSFNQSQVSLEKKAKILQNTATAAQGIELLLFDLDMISLTQSRMPFLVSPEELERAERYKFDQLGREYLLRRHILRCLLSNRLKTDPDTIRFTNNLKESVRDTNVVAVVIPSHDVRKVMTEIKDSVEDSAIWITAVKGIENKTFLRMSEVIA